MKIEKLTRGQLENLYGYSGDTDNQVLSNGEIGYCKATHILVICCGNCGNYTHIHVRLKDKE